MFTDRLPLMWQALLFLGCITMMTKALDPKIDCQTVITSCDCSAPLPDPPQTVLFSTDCPSPQQASRAFDLAVLSANLPDDDSNITCARVNVTDYAAALAEIAELVGSAGSVLKNRGIVRRKLLSGRDTLATAVNQLNGIAVAMAADQEALLNCSQACACPCPRQVTVCTTPTGQNATVPAPMPDTGNVTGTYIYLYDRQNVTSTLYTLDVANTTAGWTKRAPTPGNFRIDASVVVDNVLWVFGSIGPVEVPFHRLTLVLTYSHASNAWSARSPLVGVSAIGAAAISIGSQVYIFGGVTAQNETSHICIKYNTETGSWYTVSKLPLPGRDLVVAASRTGGLIYIGRKDWPLLYVYDSESDAWPAPLVLPVGFVLEQAVGLDDHRIQLLAWNETLLINGTSGDVLDRIQLDPAVYSIRVATALNDTIFLVGSSGQLLELDGTTGSWTPVVSVPTDPFAIQSVSVFNSEPALPQAPPASPVNGPVGTCGGIGLCTNAAGPVAGRYCACPPGVIGATCELSQAPLGQMVLPLNFYRGHRIAARTASVETWRLMVSKHFANGPVPSSASELIALYATGPASEATEFWAALSNPYLATDELHLVDAFLASRLPDISSLSDPTPACFSYVCIVAYNCSDAGMQQTASWLDYAAMVLMENVMYFPMYAGTNPVSPGHVNVFILGNVSGFCGARPGCDLGPTGIYIAAWLADSAQQVDYLGATCFWAMWFRCTYDSIGAPFWTGIPWPYSDAFPDAWWFAGTASYGEAIVAHMNWQLQAAYAAQADVNQLLSVPNQNVFMLDTRAFSLIAYFQLWYTFTYAAELQYSFLPYLFNQTQQTQQAPPPLPSWWSANMHDPNRVLVQLVASQGIPVQDSMAQILLDFGTQGLLLGKWNLSPGRYPHPTYLLNFVEPSTNVEYTPAQVAVVPVTPTGDYSVITATINSGGIGLFQFLQPGVGQYVKATVFGESTPSFMNYAIVHDGIVYSSSVQPTTNFGPVSISLEATLPVDLVIVSQTTFTSDGFNFQSPFNAKLTVQWISASGPSKKRESSTFNANSTLSASDIFATVDVFWDSFAWAVSAAEPAAFGYLFNTTMLGTAIPTQDACHIAAAVNVSCSSVSLLDHNTVEPGIARADMSIAANTTAAAQGLVSSLIAQVWAKYPAIMVSLGHIISIYPIAPDLASPS